MADKILIFDFDGTIADTFHYIIRIANQLAPQYGYRTISDNDVDFLHDKTAKEVISYLKVPLLKIPAILAHAKRVFHDGINDIQLINGLHDVLHSLHRHNFTMGIVSSNAAENIRQFLANHDLNIFDFFHSTTKIWSKNHSITKLIKLHKFNPQNVFYIGDETRDISAARKCNIKSIAVTWGYNSRQALENESPDFIVDSPQNLLNLLTQ